MRTNRRHQRMQISLCVTVAGLIVASAASASDAFRTKLEKWVETQQLISREKSEWDADQGALRATRDLLREQRDFLAAEIEKLEASSTAADDERRDLLVDRAAFQQNNSLLENELVKIEQSILEIAGKFPAPLARKLEPLLVQIPTSPEAATPKLGPRLMNVLGVLAQADKFNSTATFVGETRAVNDQQLQVRTLYWGLAQAIYVDSLGNTAGIGRPYSSRAAQPPTSGWDFESDPELARSAKLLLDIYEGNVDTIEFVEFPVEAR